MEDSVGLTSLLRTEKKNQNDCKYLEGDNVVNNNLQAFVKNKHHTSIISAYVK